MLWQGVANRDLKLENLLLTYKAGWSRPLLKICDFGYSKVWSRAQCLLAFEQLSGIHFALAPVRYLVIFGSLFALRRMRQMLAAIASHAMLCRHAESTGKVQLSLT